MIVWGHEDGADVGIERDVENVEDVEQTADVAAAAVDEMVPRTQVKVSETEDVFG